MTQIQHISAKEMTRRTGVENALGYTYPDKDLILLKKGLKGKKKKEVLDHEINHLRKGEEGPFIQAITSMFAGKARTGGFNKALQGLGDQYQEGREDLSPYRNFGRDQMEGPNGLSEWAKTGFQAPTMEDVRGTQGYQSGLDAVENSAAARGGALSGNALIEAADYGGRAYDREYGRRENTYQNELARRMGFANLGYRAADRSAGLGETYGGRLADLEVRRGQSKADTWSDFGSGISGATGMF